MHYCECSKRSRNNLQSGPDLPLVVSGTRKYYSGVGSLRFGNLCSVRYPDCIFGGPYKQSAGDGVKFGRVYIRMTVSVIAGSHNPNPPFPPDTAGLIKTSPNGAGGGYFLRQALVAQTFLSVVGRCCAEHARWNKRMM
jgi:hypothetical protein